MENREIVSSAFKFKFGDYPIDDWRGSAAKYPLITNKVLQDSYYIDKLNDVFLQITEFRNDLNHAGYRNNPTTAL